MPKHLPTIARDALAVGAFAGVLTGVDIESAALTGVLMAIASAVTELLATSRNAAHRM
jgi:hypothetical protein